MKLFKPPPKRKKLDPPQSSNSSHTTTSISEASPSALLHKRDAAVMALISKPTVQTVGVNVMAVQQARDAAVAQAQQEGCKGNFRIFDSPYGNYLVPVIPTRAELLGG